MNNHLENNLKISELKLVQSIYNDRLNYLEIKDKINVSNFLDENMKLLYTYADILYRKYDYDKLDKTRIKAIISGEDLQEEIKDLLSINVDILGIDYGLDTKGEYELYSKNLGLYNFNKFFEGNGELEGLLKKLDNIDYNTDDIRQYLQHNIDKCFSQYKSKPQESFIELGLDDLLDKIDKNEMELGIRQRFNTYTNYFTGGIFKGVHYLGATSGLGKTTWSMLFYLLPILLSKDSAGNREEKILIIANEQDKETFQKMIMVCFYYNIYRTLKKNKHLINTVIKRHKLERGNATPLEKKLLRETSEYFKKEFSKRIKFVFMPKFTPYDIEYCILNNSRLGFKNVLIDTMKAEQKGEYQLLSNLATKLDMLAKSEDLKIIATVQLAIYSMNKKYLDHTCLSESKQIVEIAEHSLYFRYTDLLELATLSVFEFQKKYNEETGEAIGVEKVQIPFDKIQSDFDKNPYNKYMLVFIGKNRHGESGKVVLSKYNFDVFYYEEIGIVEGIKYDKL